MGRMGYLRLRRGRPGTPRGSCTGVQAHPLPQPSQQPISAVGRRRLPGSPAVPGLGRGGRGGGTLPDTCEGHRRGVSPGLRTSAERGPRSPSPSWRPPWPTCSWRPPAAPGCRGWPCSSPRACPARSCTRCQVGPGACPRSPGGGRGGGEEGDADGSGVRAEAPGWYPGRGPRGGGAGPVGGGRGGVAGRCGGVAGRCGGVAGPRGGQRPPRPPPAAQMVLTDLSAPEERPTALGRLGLCYGSSTILGSLLGGTLSAACG